LTFTARQNRLSRKTNFARRINHIRTFKTLIENISLFQKCKSVISSARPEPTRGAFRDRHERWVRDAMDVLATPDERCEYVRRNRVVLIPRRWDQACKMAMSAEADTPGFASDGGNKARSPGRARISRQTIAQGMPYVSACL
jgi:hypothetical protein